VRNGSSGDFQLYTNHSNSIPKLVVENEGNVGIGFHDPQYKLDVFGTARVTGFINTSSRQLKEEIRQLSSEEALESLEGLDPVSYYFKADEKRDRQLGFIAEEVPEQIAAADRTGIKPLDIIAVLTKVVRDQQERISTLEARLTRMERKRH
jgi:hypothetical protein